LNITSNLYIFSRQERRLAQFQQERDEQKQRQTKRQEKKAQEMEEYLCKQRVRVEIIFNLLNL
jgi:hypothetical protein